MKPAPLNNVCSRAGKPTPASHTDATKHTYQSCACKMYATCVQLRMRPHATKTQHPPMQPQTDQLTAGEEGLWQHITTSGLAAHTSSLNPTRMHTCSTAATCNPGPDSNPAAGGRRLLTADRTPPAAADSALALGTQHSRALSALSTRSRGRALRHPGLEPAYSALALGTQHSRVLSAAQHS